MGQKKERYGERSVVIGLHSVNRNSNHMILVMVSVSSSINPLAYSLFGIRPPDTFHHSFLRLSLIPGVKPMWIVVQFLSLLPSLMAKTCLAIWSTSYP